MLHRTQSLVRPRRVPPPALRADGPAPVQHAFGLHVVPRLLLRLREADHPPREQVHAQLPPRQLHVLPLLRARRQPAVLHPAKRVRVRRRLHRAAEVGRVADQRALPGRLREPPLQAHGRRQPGRRVGEPLRPDRREEARGRAVPPLRGDRRARKVCGELRGSGGLRGQAPACGLGGPRQEAQTVRAPHTARGLRLPRLQALRGHPGPHDHQRQGRGEAGPAQAHPVPQCDVRGQGALHVGHHRAERQ
mmetsp:Transcript_21705/g.68745  ORF Transcript_21705/g.68745 Transcript_21705/m.68745 type:complete len:248 (-) Transcript_21705:614-1357(-)